MKTIISGKGGTPLSHPTNFFLNHKVERILGQQLRDLGLLLIQGKSFTGLRSLKINALRQFGKHIDKIFHFDFTNGFSQRS